VRARPGRVFEVVLDPAGYPAWWPGARALGDGRLALPGIPPARVETDRVRPGTGLYVRFGDGRGDASGGHLEWYLEAYEEGTVVSCIADLRVPRAWRERRLLRMRAGFRGALVALKGMLE
jgi:uncharacterized protein YndB with AHSA1/START domain